MTQLDRTQLMGAAGALLPSTNFDVAPQTTTSGGGGGNAGVFTPIGSFFFVYKLSDQIRSALPPIQTTALVSISVKNGRDATT